MSDHAEDSVLPGQVPVKLDGDDVDQMAEVADIDEPAMTASDQEALAAEAKEEGNYTRTLMETAKNTGEGGVVERTTQPESCIGDVERDGLYRRVREFALGAINAVRRRAYRTFSLRFDRAGFTSIFTGNANHLKCTGAVMIH